LKTLIIPCAGKSSRFLGEKPKWMLEDSKGVSMISKSTEALIGLYDKVIITVTSSQEEKFDCQLFLKKVFKGKTVDVCILKNDTFSASETVFETIRQKSVKGFITIKDSDCDVQFDPEEKEEYIVGKKVDSDTRRLNAKSFIIKDENDIVIDIMEKRIVSSQICVGVYSCLCDHFERSYKNIIDSGLRLCDAEVYVSHVFSHIILKYGNIFNYVECSKYLDFGTEKEWKENKDE